MMRAFDRHGKFGGGVDRLDFDSHLIPHSVHKQVGSKKDQAVQKSFLLDFFLAQEFVFS